MPPFFISSSSKSTLARLLLRFYDPSSGSILVGGQVGFTDVLFGTLCPNFVHICAQDIREVTQSSVRAAFGVVPQVDLY
jgi:ABC-type multidrug transport system fused ATPase/permease subunit